MYFYLYKIMSKIEMCLPFTEMSELLLHSFRTGFVEATQDRKQDKDTFSTAAMTQLSLILYLILLPPLTGTRTMGEFAE